MFQIIYKLLTIFSLQLVYEGKKTYRESSGSKQNVQQGPKTIILKKTDRSAEVKNLQPKMKYEFNISAVFSSGEVGYVKHIVAETLIDCKYYSHFYLNTCNCLYCTYAIVAEWSQII